RRGYGRTGPRAANDFDGDVDDVVALLGDGAHLVGYSYGGLVSLLVAARRPDLVRSLVLIEPPAFGVAPDRPDARRQVGRLAALYPTDRLTPEEYRVGFLRAVVGRAPDSIRLDPEERRAVVAAMAEAPPWEAPIDLDAVAAAPCPKLVVSGGVGRRARRRRRRARPAPRGRAGGDHRRRPRRAADRGAVQPAPARVLAGRRRARGRRPGLKDGATQNADGAWSVYPPAPRRWRPLLRMRRSGAPDDGGRRTPVPWWGPSPVRTPPGRSCVAPGGLGKGGDVVAQPRGKA
ncbi:MAG: alpha/beta hydrolase, partial [Chloroflexota bacterium]|nr:alpha/beta hydrolase [Chloroflexota bacterium]